MKKVPQDHLVNAVIPEESAIRVKWVLMVWMVYQGYRDLKEIRELLGQRVIWVRWDPRDKLVIMAAKETLGTEGHEGFKVPLENPEPKGLRDKKVNPVYQVLRD